MSECQYWWREGAAQWCDMQGGDCACGGWEEGCDMRKTGHKRLDMESELDDVLELFSTKKKQSHRHDKAA